MSLGNTSKLLVAFITLLIGIVLVGSIASEGLGKTTKLVALNETHNVLPTILTGRNTTDINSTIVYTLTNAPTTWKTADCPITNFVMRNQSGTAFTVTTDYVLTASAGTFVFVNNAALNNSIGFNTNNTYVDYTYCGDDYMNLTWGRTSINLVPGFFAIALLLISLGLFYSVAKDTGVI